MFFQIISIQTLIVRNMDGIDSTGFTEFSFLTKIVNLGILRFRIVVGISYVYSCTRLIYGVALYVTYHIFHLSIEMPLLSLFVLVVVSLVSCFHSNLIQQYQKNMFRFQILLQAPISIFFSLFLDLLSTKQYFTCTYIYIFF